MKAISEVKPSSILDVGIGFGKFGFLIREYFDLRPGFKSGFDKWSIQLDGIEIFEEYLTPVHDYIYDTIFHGEAAKIISESTDYYDLVIAVHVLEHYRRREGEQFIEAMKSIADNIIISTPYIYYEQPPLFGNSYEEHFSGWDCSDFKMMGCKYVWGAGGSLVGVVSGLELALPDADDVSDENMTDDGMEKLMNLLNMYIETKQYEVCIETAKKYLPRLGDAITGVYLILAKCYKKLHDRVRSSAYAGKVLELDKNNSEALKILRKNR